MTGLYLHIPFCRKACHYCDFHFSTSLQIIEKMVEAMIGELRMKSELVEDKNLGTIYFGGGTPSVLPEKQLNLLFEAITKYFDPGQISEITFEVNPEDVGKETLKLWNSLGINRLSIGLQTSHNHRLQWMNRIATAEQGKRSVFMAQDAGFENISVDLIFNMPESTPNELDEDLDFVLSLDARHISAYGLTIEPRTVFGHQSEKGVLIPLPDEPAAAQFQKVTNRLRNAGFLHYEISNFGLPGFEAVHNSNYWKQVPYIGIGPSAHSYSDGKRTANQRNNPLYVQSILEDHRIPETVEILTKTEQANDMILTRLRTSAGLDAGELKLKTGFEIQNEKAAELEKAMEQGLLKIENSTLYLTDEGRLLADHLAMILMADEMPA